MHWGEQALHTYYVCKDNEDGCWKIRYGGKESQGKGPA